VYNEKTLCHKKGGLMSKDIIKMLKNITNKIKKVINNKLEEIKKDYEKHQIDLLLRKSVKELNIPKIIEALEREQTQIM
jgi:deoxyribodipyrimidine photolyase